MTEYDINMQSESLVLCKENKELKKRSEDLSRRNDMTLRILLAHIERMREAQDAGQEIPDIAELEIAARLASLSASTPTTRRESRRPPEQMPTPRTTNTPSAQSESSYHDHANAQFGEWLNYSHESAFTQQRDETTDHTIVKQEPEADGLPPIPVLTPPIRSTERRTTKRKNPPLQSPTSEPKRQRKKLPSARPSSSKRKQAPKFLRRRKAMSYQEEQELNEALSDIDFSLESGSLRFRSDSCDAYVAEQRRSVETPVAPEDFVMPSAPGEESEYEPSERGGPAPIRQVFKQPSRSSAPSSVPSDSSLSPLSNTSPRTLPPTSYKKRYSQPRRCDRRFAIGSKDVRFEYTRMPRTVAGAYREWHLGGGKSGNPAIGHLETTYGTAWRSGAATEHGPADQAEMKYGSNYVMGRRKIVRYIDDMIEKQGISSKEACRRLDDVVKGRMQRLQEAMRKELNPFEAMI